MKTHHQADRLDFFNLPRVWVVMCLFAVCFFSGCEEEAIQSYQAPKSAPYTPPAPMGPVAGGGSAAAAGDITWDLPEGWQPATDGSSMAMATFQVQADDPTRINVTELSGPAGGILSNVNRWRGQVGLAPVEKIEQQPIDPVTIDGNPAGLIDLASPPGVNAGIPRMLVVLLPRTQTDSTWFFKMTGPDDTLSEQKQNFVAFVESIRFQGATDE